MIDIIKKIMWLRHAHAVKYSNGAFAAKRKPFDDSTVESLFRDHSAGEKRVGAYSSRPGTWTCRWICLDIDGNEHSPEAALVDPEKAVHQIQSKLEELHIPYYSEISGGGAGYHIWVFFDQEVTARNAIHWMRTEVISKTPQLMLMNGEPYNPLTNLGIELYPKQDSLSKPGSLGNLVWLPGWGKSKGSPHLFEGDYRLNIVAEDIQEYTLLHEAPPKPAPTKLSLDADDRAFSELNSKNTFSAVSISKMRGWLDYLDPDDGYASWLKVGMALHSWGIERDNLDDGLALYVEWSKQSKSFDLDEIETKWRSFNEDSDPSNAVTPASIRWMAGENGLSEIKNGTHVELADFVLRGEHHDGSDFWSFNRSSGLWTKVDVREIKSRIQALDGFVYGYTAKNKPMIVRISASVVASVLSCAAIQAPYLDPLKWASSAGGCAISGRWYSPDGSSMPLSKLHMARFEVPTTYDKYATCPRWMKYLNEVVSTDTQKLLQEFVGGALFGLSTKYQAALFLFGDGSNGKSVFVDVISTLFPRDIRSSITLKNLDDAGTRASLENMRINICAELPEAELINTASFKDLVSGDSITVRKPYATAPITFKPNCGFIFAGNKTPILRGTDHGLWRRIKVAAFPNEISADKSDRGLAGALIENELPGIFRWCLDGAQRLVEQGYYTETSDGEKYKNRWRLDSDTSRAFYEDVCRPLQEGERPSGSKELYVLYEQWCEMAGKKAKSIHRWGKEMSKLCKKGRSSSGCVYYARATKQSTWSLGDTM